jgi:hypothetical protein
MVSNFGGIDEGDYPHIFGPYDGVVCDRERIGGGKPEGPVQDQQG